MGVHEVHSLSVGFSPVDLCSGQSESSCRLRRTSVYAHVLVVHVYTLSRTD